MSNNIKQKSRIFLKRNRYEEITLNYHKIYNLAEIDSLSNITQDQKIKLLITIKKLLLCTYNYIDQSILEELAYYFTGVIIIFLFYAIIFSPLYSYFIKSDKETDKKSSWIIFEEFFYYMLTEILEIIVRICLDLYQKNKVIKMMIFYANNEIAKNDSLFSIKINSHFDLEINKYSSYIKNNKVHNLFYQYVINYPNVRYYKWCKNILNDAEKEICRDIIINLNQAEDIQISKSYSGLTLIFVLYFFAFRYLAVNDYSHFLFYRALIFIITKLMSVYVSNNLKKNLIVRGELLNMKYLSQGYYIVLNGPLIQIYKLKEEYIKDDKEFKQEKYKFFQDEVKKFNELINN